jgi:glycosyltransferase involved in cell wall biosynthesis
MSPPPAPRLLYLVTEDWYFISHRLPMARAARDAGFEVHVATRVDRHADAILAEGFTLHPVAWRRGSLNPWHIWANAREIRALYRRLAPDLVHHISLQASVVGSLAARGLRIARVNALAGLGFTFASPTLKARLLRLALRCSIGPLLGGPRAVVLVQNPDDGRQMAALGLDPTNIVLIPGSGVDVAALTPLPEPPPPFTYAFAGRMIADKGVATLVAAHRGLRARGLDFRLLLAGAPDQSNPASIPRATLEGWGAEPGCRWLGRVEDIRALWAAAHVAVQPSRGGEGVPKSLLEAAACGRPIVATDVPGCREIARPGVNGLLVPPGNADALADALATLAADPALRARFAAAGRKIVEAEFSDTRVGREIVALYRRLLGVLGEELLAAG